MQSQPSRHDRGLSLLHRIGGADGATPLQHLGPLAPDLAELTVAFGYGDLLSRPNLDIKTRQFLTVAALAALGNAQPQLRFHLKGALNVGWEPWEILELPFIAAVFAGFPSALNLVTAASGIFEECGWHGSAETPLGRARALADSHRRPTGLVSLQAISGESGTQVLDSISAIEPDLAGYILDFSYGDVLSRPGLPAPLKELVVIAMLTAMRGLEPQLRVHIHAALKVGCRREEILEAILQMAGYAGFPATLNGMQVAGSILQSCAAPSCWAT